MNPDSITKLMEDIKKLDLPDKCSTLKIKSIYDGSMIIKLETSRINADYIKKLYDDGRLSAILSDSEIKNISIYNVLNQKQKLNNAYENKFNENNGQASLAYDNGKINAYNNSIVLNLTIDKDITPDSITKLMEGIKALDLPDKSNPLKIKDIHDGSMVIKLETSRTNADYIKKLYDDGRLSELLNNKVIRMDINNSMGDDITNLIAYGLLLGKYKEAEEGVCP